MPTIRNVVAHGTVEEKNILLDDGEEVAVRAEPQIASLIGLALVVLAAATAMPIAVRRTRA